MFTEHLRIAILLPAPIVPAWAQRVIWDVATGDLAILALVVVDASAETRRHSRLSGAAFRAYEALDRRFFRFPGDHAAPVDASALLKDVPTIRARPARSATGATLSAADVEAIRRHRPDVLLSLGFPLLEGEALGVAPLGLWRFDHLDGDDRVPPLAWEMLRGAPTTATALRAVTPEGTRVLQRSFATTDRNSLHRSRNAAIWKSAGFVARALRAAAAGREGADETLPAPPFEAPARAPNAFELARFAGGVAARVLRHRRQRQRADYLWFVALRRSRGSFVDGPLEGFRPVPMPPGHFYADPFLAEDGGKSWLFFEDADTASGKGLLRCAEVLADGSLGESRVVLDCEYHLSYPFVFRQGGQWYMLPETSENRTLELWRATSFPWRWELEKVLMRDIVVVDPTLLEHGGRLWLFANQSETGGAAHDELFLFHAASLQDEWQPHPLNPIVSDLRRARPAGALFVEDGRLYRPAQDCSGEYGSAIWLHRVDVLDERSYRETPVRHIDASWHPGATGTHTLSRGGGFDAIDAKMWVPRAETVG